MPTSSLEDSTYKLGLMYGGSFSEEQLYSAKSFLTALKDSHNCIREAARHRADEEMYAQAAQKLLQAQKKGLVEFKNGHVVHGGAWKGSDLSKQTQNIRYSLLTPGPLLINIWETLTELRTTPA